MKILCLSRAPLDFKGGIPTYCLNLYGNNKFEVISYSYDLSKKLRRKEKRTIQDIQEIIFPSEIIFGTLAISTSYFFAILANSKNFNVIHIQHPDPFSSICSILTKIKNPNIKLIVTWHADIYSSYLLFSPILIFIDFLLFCLSSKIIFFTKMHLKNSFIKNIKFLRNKVKLIPCCININLNRNHKNKIEYSLKNKKSINLISIGRLVKYKGYEFAIKAILETNKNVNYKIIGNGPLKKNLQDLINFYKLEDRVFLMEKINDKEKNKLLSEADIFLFPSISNSEAYGLVQFEAMANYLPIINTFLNNGVNFLAPDDVAITCKIKNSFEISKAINKLINDEEFYLNKKNKSFNNLSRFKLEYMLSDFENLLLEI
tara:strand:- start:7447 stop:8565 length:1119 start_codon:yes stop_codon:yes gene_type:complete